MLHFLAALIVIGVFGYIALVVILHVISQPSEDVKLTVPAPKPPESPRTGYEIDNPAPADVANTRAKSFFAL